MSGPFNVIPNSNADKALQEAAGLRFDQGGSLSSKISPILKKYGVDTVTQSAVEAAADQLAANPNMDVPRLAQGLVGTAVSDPRVAANQAKSYVESQKGLTAEQEKQVAITAAGDAAEDAGADRASAEAEAANAISQGVSPAMAASAGAAIAVTAAVTSNPAANPGIEIFGHLKALVQGLVTETYLKTEDKTVTSTTDWKMGNSFIQTTSGQLHVYCKDYYAEADHDVSQRQWSIGLYQKGYTMTAPDPVFVTGGSLSLLGFAFSKYTDKILSFALNKEVLFGFDLYTAILGTAKTNITDEDVQKRKQKYVFGLHSRSRTNFN